MSAMSDYLENKLVDHIFRARAFSLPASIYVALFTAAPSDSGGGTEVAGNNYARAQLAPSDSNWAATQGGGPAAPSSGTGGVTSNKVAISFPTPSGNWGLVTHWGVFDAVSGGNLLFHGALSIQKTINQDDVVEYPIDAFVVTFA